MESRKVKNITPKMLSSFVSFDRSNPSWTYKRSKQGMHEKQAEGAAYIFNLLNERGLALLADEVGMGKTIWKLLTVR